MKQYDKIVSSIEEPNINSLWLKDKKIWYFENGWKQLYDKDTVYELPVASTTTLGGIKQATNISNVFSIDSFGVAKLDMGVYSALTAGYKMMSSWVGYVGFHPLDFLSSDSRQSPEACYNAVFNTAQGYWGGIFTECSIKPLVDWLTETHLPEKGYVKEETLTAKITELETTIADLTARLEALEGGI